MADEFRNEEVVVDVLILCVDQIDKAIEILYNE